MPDGFLHNRFIFQNTQKCKTAYSNAEKYRAMPRNIKGCRTALFYISLCFLMPQYIL